jgi:uncharacterized protein YndB with AHSA1/START domain
MAVLSIRHDNEALTLTVVSEFDASVERVWQVWADPRRLERWWGPPTWPATFDRYEFKPGGAIGMEDGLRLAIGQIDDLLAEGSRA